MAYLFIPEIKIRTQMSALQCAEIHNYSLLYHYLTLYLLQWNRTFLQGTLLAFEKRSNILPIWTVVVD